MAAKRNKSKAPLSIVRRPGVERYLTFDNDCELALREADGLSVYRCNYMSDRGSVTLWTTGWRHDYAAIREVLELLGAVVNPRSLTSTHGGYPLPADWPWKAGAQ